MLHNPDKKVDVVADESKQIKEPETHVSSQPKIEEVKQASDKGEQATSLKKSIVITGNSLSRLSNKLIYQNYQTSGRRDNHGRSNFTCLVLATYQ